MTSFTMGLAHRNPVKSTILHFSLILHTNCQPFSCARHLKKTGKRSAVFNSFNSKINTNY